MRQFMKVAGCALLLSACGGGSDVANESPKLLAQTQAAAVVASDYDNLLQRIYLAYLGYPADPGGQRFWTELFSQQGFPTDVAGLLAAYDSNLQVRRLLDSFFTSSQTLYAGTPGEIVNAIYINLLGRQAEAAGRTYWSGQRLATLPLEILNGAQGSDQLLIEKKLKLSKLFTASAAALGSAADMLWIRPVGSLLLGEVTLDSDPATFQATVDAAIHEYTWLLNLGRSYYAGFYYLSDVGAGAAYPVTYTARQAEFSPTWGTLRFGAGERSIDFSSPLQSPYAITYGAPVSYAVHVPADTRISVNSGPVIAMLCQAVAGAGGARGKSTDILVSNSLRMITTARELANQTISVYREDCATREEGAPAPNALSYAFDKDGNVTVLSATGSNSYLASFFSAVLNGQVILDAAAREYTSLRAYSYQRSDGSVGYAMVSHSSPQLSGATTGRLALWSQE